MFKRFFKLLEKHEQIEKEQQKTIIEQYTEIVRYRTVLTNIKLITELNRTGMADTYLAKINELVTNVENDN